MQNIKDDNGEIAGIAPDTIIIPNDAVLKKQVFGVLGADQVPETDGNAFDNALNIIDENDYGHFFVPENVYIIGTMNDIDRSVESMDFAFRRRFAWAEVEARDTVRMLDTLPQVWAEEAKRRMEKLNDAISATQDFGPAYHIGASYFLKLNQYGGDFVQLWDYHIKGILEEYVRGHPNKTDLMEKFKSAYSDGTTE